MKSIWFDSVNRYYNMGFYNNENTKIFVVADMITAEEYEKITGVKYVQ